nr:MAG TPA: coat protein [Inoviridae sp.]
MAQALTTAFEAVKTDVTGMLTNILPIAAGIAGGFIAVKLGFKYFKGLAK